MDTMSCYTLSLIFLHTQTLCPLRIPFAFHLGLIFFVYSKYADDMKETLSVDQKGPDVAYAMVISKYLHQKEQILDAKVSPAAFHIVVVLFSCLLINEFIHITVTDVSLHISTCVRTGCQNN